MPRYNLELLKSESEKYGFKLIGEYEELTNISNIKGTCISDGCKGIFEKPFRNLYRQQSYHCKECIIKSKIIKVRQRYEEKTDEQKKVIQKKTEDTNMKKFGTKSPTQNKEIKKKQEDTNMKRYGVKAALQNAEIAKKAGKNAYKLKSYILPSGRIINLQGYEHHCIDDLMKKENIDENDILYERDDVPEIWYKDENNVERRHFVDFFIKSLNKMIEVKSTWTLDKKLDKIFHKQKAAKELGYDYEIRVYSEKGKLLKTYS